MKQIPLNKRMKTPRDNDWRRNVYTLDQINAWREKGGNTGLRLEPGDLVIDVDPKHEDAKGRTARELLEDLEIAFFLDFSTHLIVETGGNVPGLHVHMTKPEDVRTREKLKDLFGGAIEFKTAGRQVLAPGCTHPDGGTYRVVQKAARQPCPSELLEAITKPKTERKSGEDAEVAPAHLKEMLDLLDPADHSDYDEWRDIMFACHHGTNGSAEGLEVFKAWSLRDGNYADSGGEIDTFWENSDPEHGDGRTIKSLYWRLNDMGLGVPTGDPRVEFADIIAKIQAEPDQPYIPKWRFGPKPKKGEGGRRIRADLIHNVREFIKLADFRFYYDEFSGNVFHEETEELFTDDHTLDLSVLISDTMGKRWTGDVAKDRRHDAILAEARTNRRHPLRDYLCGLKWDGEKRLETWLIKHARAEPNAYVRAISRLFLVAAVGRVLQPGCKFDLMLVLEGPQGVGKSSLVRELGGEWALEGLPPLRASNDKDVVDAMRGYWIIEMEEMNVARKENADCLKAFITRRMDRVRLPYDTNSRNFIRRCVLIGTTNDSQYLRDSTGNRRFIPVKVGRVDLKGLNRDQLWAEAVLEWNKGPFYDDTRLSLPESLWAFAAEEQDKRRSNDPWEEQIAEVVEKFRGQGFMSTEALLQEGVLIMPQNQGTRETRRLSNVMQRLGIEAAKSRVDKVQKRGYYMPEEEMYE